MKLATASEEREIPGSEEGAGPLENPAIDGIEDDPLVDPHPSEPGVKGDGGAAAPLENPGRPRS